MEILNKMKSQINDEKIEKIKSKNESGLFYIEKVDLTFQTLDKALLDCMSVTTNHLLVSTGFSSKDTPNLINLLNFLNQQHLSCKKFIDDYGKLKEIV